MLKLLLQATQIYSDLLLPIFDKILARTILLFFSLFCHISLLITFNIVPLKIIAWSMYHQNSSVKGPMYSLRIKDFHGNYNLFYIYHNNHFLNTNVSNRIGKKKRLDFIMIVFIILVKY